MNTDYSITPEPDHDHGHEAHDEWFKHTADEPDAQEAHGEVNAPFIIAFLSVVILATFAVAVLFLVYFGQALRDATTERREGRTSILASEYNEKVAQWNQSLYGQPEWQDTERGLVSIPLDLAKRSVLERYSQNGEWRSENPGE
jgi:hypothetical protein